MFYFLKKYWKYFLLILVIVFMFVISFINSNDDTVITENEKKLSDSNKLKNKKENNTVFVDIKGAINSPGVYEIEEGKRITDVITLAGGLTSDSYTKNLNLSKKVEDEMYLIIYTTKEIEDYIKNNSSNSTLKCVSTECVCPDTNNKACNSVKKTTTSKKISMENNNTEKNTITGKISINTASKEELMTLDGIGESKAQKIIDYRNSNGLFEKIEDILNVSGIGESIFNKIKDSIEV